MKAILIVTVLIGLVLVAGFVMANADFDNEEEVEQIQSCSSCRNSCSATNNCGLSSCGAVTGRSCGCNS
jgi:uncharacterized protein YxeA